MHKDGSEDGVRVGWCRGWWGTKQDEIWFWSALVPPFYDRRAFLNLDEAPSARLGGVQWSEGPGNLLSFITLPRCPILDFLLISLNFWFLLTASQIWHLWPPGQGYQWSHWKQCLSWEYCRCLPFMNVEQLKHGYLIRSWWIPYLSAPCLGWFS